MTKAIVLGGFAALFSVAQIGEDCRDCHAAIVASYAQTGMARALRPLDPSEVEGLAVVDDPASGFRYRFERRGAKAFVVEDWRASDGKLRDDARNESELSFAIGAGLFDTSFAALRGGMTWFAPLEVIAARGGGSRIAQLAPGHMSNPGLRFDNPIQEECLACHTDALPPSSYPLNLAPPSSWSPRGIDCSHCHPASDRHASWRRAELEGKKPSERDPLAERTPRDAIERVSICARCHLQGDARILLESDAKLALSPGGDFLSRAAVFTAKPGTDDIGFVAQVERMVLSKCFTASIDGARPMSCETCHDPHRSIADEKERTSVHAACTKCHATNDADRAAKSKACSLALDRREGRDCASCHMRVTPTFDVKGVAIWDHEIRRVAKAPSKFERVRPRQSDGGEIARFRWPNRAPPLDGDPGLQMLALAAVDRADDARRFAAIAPDPIVQRLAVYHHVRGTLFDGAGEFEEARKAYERALILDSSSEATRTNLGLVLAETNRPKEGLAMLDALVAAKPSAVGALRNRALVKLALGDSTGAANDLERAQAILPRAEIARALAELARRAGRNDDAERRMSEARRLDPTRD